MFYVVEQSEDKYMVHFLTGQGYLYKKSINE